MLHKKIHKGVPQGGLNINIALFISFPVNTEAKKQGWKCGTKMFLY